MIEFFTLTVLTLIVVSLIRPGKTPPLDNPLIIERPGQYHMTLAPQLNLAQPIIEEIAKQIAHLDNAPTNFNTLCFEVRDKEVTAHGNDFYLLAITRCHGVIYFQALPPKSLDRKAGEVELIQFASAVLVNIDRTASQLNEKDNADITAAVIDSALKRGVTIHKIGSSSG